MLGMKRVTIAQHERGLLFRNRSFVAVLEPGVRWIFDPLRRTEIEVRDLTVPEFEKKHTKKPRSGRRRIKELDDTCQFLGPDHRCTVYTARPTDCRGYVCWDQDDKTVYEFARFAQLTTKKLREVEQAEAAKAQVYAAHLPPERASEITGARRRLRTGSRVPSGRTGRGRR